MANDIYQGLMRMKYNQDAIGKICYARDFKEEGVANNLMPSINQAMGKWAYLSRNSTYNACRERAVSHR